MPKIIPLNDYIEIAFLKEPWTIVESSTPGINIHIPKEAGGNFGAIVVKVIKIPESTSEKTGIKEGDLILVDRLAILNVDKLLNALYFINLKSVIGVISNNEPLND